MDFEGERQQRIGSLKYEAQIEVLTAERDSLKQSEAATQALYKSWHDRALKAEAERDALKARAEKAEAELGRLTDAIALKDATIRTAIDHTNGHFPGTEAHMRSLLREALRPTQEAQP